MHGNLNCRSNRYYRKSSCELTDYLRTLKFKTPLISSVDYLASFLNVRILKPRLPVI